MTKQISKNDTINLKIIEGLLILKLKIASIDYSIWLGI
jgi:hypothetical protein